MRAPPTIAIHNNPGPGPVKASEVGEPDAAAAAEGEVDVAPDDEEPDAAVAGATTGLVGVLDGAGTGAAVGVGVGVGVEAGVPAVVGVGVVGVGVVGVVGEAVTWATRNPPTLLPETSPGLVSPTKV